MNMSIDKTRCDGKSGKIQNSVNTSIEETGELCQVDKTLRFDSCFYEINNMC